MVSVYPTSRSKVREKNPSEDISSHCTYISLSGEFVCVCVNVPMNFSVRITCRADNQHFQGSVFEVDVVVTFLDTITMNHKSLKIYMYLTYYIQFVEVHTYQKFKNIRRAIYIPNFALK